MKKKYFKQVKNLRRNNPFELFILENEKKYLNISKNRIIKFNKTLKLSQTPKHIAVFQIKTRSPKLGN